MTHTVQPGPIPTEFDSDEMSEQPTLSILAILVVLLRRKTIIVFGTLIVMSATGIAVAFMRDTFKAEAVILPPQQQQSSLTVLASGALGGIGGLAGSGIASQLGLKNPADLYIGMLRSRTISDKIIERFRLQDLYQKKSLSDARTTLRTHTAFTSGKESMITISVEDHDRKRAAAMANAFVDELYRFNSQLAITDASQRRLFFEQRLRKEKDALSESEIELKNTQQSTGLLLPGGQAEALIHSATQLRAQIMSREVALQAARSYATDQNPQIQVLQREIATMQGELAQIENNGSQNSRLEVAGGKLPQASLEYFRKFREFKYHETLYELLAKQYEAAQIDESKEAPVIQVIDRANVPDKKFGPARLALVFASAVLGLVLTSVYVLVAHHLGNLSSSPEQAEVLAELRAAVGFSKPLTYKAKA